MEDVGKEVPAREEGDRGKGGGRRLEEGAERGGGGRGGRRDRQEVVQNLESKVSTPAA